MLNSNPNKVRNTVGLIWGDKVCATGVSISPNYVVTAAHVIMAHDIAPLIWANDRPSELIKCISIIIHPRYKNFYHSYDLAIIKTAQQVCMKGDVVELVRKDEKIESINSLFMYGFGFQSVSLPTYPLKRDVSLLGSSTPTKLWRKVARPGATYGDSGSGLFGKIGLETRLIAIESGRKSKASPDTTFIRLDGHPGNFVRQLIKL